MKNNKKIATKKYTLISLLIPVIVFIPGIQFLNALEINYPSVNNIRPSDNPFIYLKYFFSFIILISGIIGFLVLVVAGIRYLTSLGKPEKLQKAKKQLTSAFLGIILLLGSYIILYTINPNLVSFKEPEFPTSYPEIPKNAPINLVPTADLLMRIRILAEAAKRVPPIIKKTSDNINQITDKCDCERTQAICVCENFGPKDIKPWYTVYGHMDQIYVSAGQKVNRGDIIGEVGSVGNIGQAEGLSHLHFAVGIETQGSSIYDKAVSFDIYSAVSAPNGQIGLINPETGEILSLPKRAEGTFARELPPWFTSEHLNFILGTLIPPLNLNHCQWYEVMGSFLHTKEAYWAQDWVCIEECKFNKEKTESAKVYVMSGGENIISTVEAILPQGGVVIKHELKDPRPCYENKEEPACIGKTCYTGNKFHPCPDSETLKQKQKNIIDQRDIILYYKNRFIEERKDLERDIKEFINEEIKWLEEEIKKKEKNKNLSERLAKLKKEKEDKNKVINKIKEITKALEEFRDPTTKLPQFSAQCFTNVATKCQATCKKGTDYGCHDKSLGCQPDSCIGGNPCPKKEIIAQINEIDRVKSETESLIKQLISIIDSIKEGPKPDKK